MDVFRRYGNLLRADGTNQLQRLLPGLEADYIVPDERALSDLMDYALQVAKEVRFYDMSGQAVGDWRALVESFLDPGTLDVPDEDPRILPLSSLDALLASRNDWPPHVVLFVTFLRLFQHLQQDLNQLTAKHLQHYFERELGLERRAAVGDQVHVIFDLARNAAPTLLRSGTALDAGKDAQGRTLTYVLPSEQVISAAAVSGMRRLVVERDRRRNRRFFVAGGFTPLEGAAGYTFGLPQLDVDPSRRFMTELSLGFAIASPILQLAEGERTINVRARLRTPDPTRAPINTQGIAYGLTVALTGAQGWLTPDSVTATLIQAQFDDPPELAITLTLGVGADAVVAFDSALHGTDLASNQPVLRCLVSGESAVYELLDGLVVTDVSIDVAVKGVRDLAVQNADGALNASQPLPLFGSQPALGAAFYIGSAEVFAKRLTSLRCHLTWQAPPADLYAHYSAYFDVKDDVLRGMLPNSFRVDLDLLYDRVFYPLLPNQSLFAIDPKDTRTLFADPTVFDLAFGAHPYVAQPDLELPAILDSGTRFGFLRMVLEGPTAAELSLKATTIPFEAFGHTAFSRRYANTALILSRPNPPAGTELPAAPYTPILSKLSLDYTATTSFVSGDRRASGSFFVCGPFGCARASDTIAARLVPMIDGQAWLVLGVEKFEAPGLLSLLFQIDAGTATANEVLGSGETEWSFLSGDVWRALPAAAMLSDSTQGFQKPGLIVLAIPSEATREHGTLPSGLVWLRALIRRAPDSAARTFAIRTQAALAQFAPGAVPMQEYLAHLQSGLPANTITRLRDRMADIKRVQQPYPSFGGASGETEREYFRRASERLRHRNRAVTAWDLERLVLEAFPEVFKVKCLPHTDAAGNAKAGHTALVIVPSLRRAGGSNVLEPRAGEVLLAAIRKFLAPLVSPFATVHVIRPIFERIRVEARVAFAAGRDPGFHAALLNDELRRFLSPWAFQEGEDILFGARIYRSEILAFIEGRAYVDHLTDLKLYHSFDGARREGIGFMTIGTDFFIRANPRPGIADMQVGATLVVGRGVEVAETTQPHAILVSHPDHLIASITPDVEDCAGVTTLGIGYMTIGLDFRPQPEPGA